jgi:hypothetical protein
VTTTTATRQIAALIATLRERDPLAADAVAELARQDFTAEQWTALARFATVALSRRS